MSRLSPIVVALTGMRSVVAGAEHLLSELHTRLSAAIEADDMGEVQAIVDDINTSKAELAAAVAANTPAETGAISPRAGEEAVDLGNSQGAESVAGSALENDSVTAPGVTGTDSVAGGAGDDTIDGGQGSDAVTTGDAAPVAVMTTDPGIVGQIDAKGETLTAVIITDHPSDGTVLVTPVIDGDHEDIQEGDVTVDPATGVPSVDPSAGVTLGDTAVAMPSTPTAAVLADQNPDAVVSAAADEPQA